MGLTFPTGHDSRQGARGLGTPDRARGCRCLRSLVADETCLWCGRFPPETINGTWSRRGQEVERAAAGPVPFEAREWSLEAHRGRPRKISVLEVV